ncbi:MAG TPA: hypothetical protein VEJ42_06560 [Streptosporangiaceae bacterium]|nr:hypothetical protein [Streptosporangiaceae bacterium]
MQVDGSFDWDEQRIDSVECTLEGYEGWVIRPEIDVTDRGLRIRRLVIEPVEETPQPGITSRMLQRIRTGELIAAVRTLSDAFTNLAGTPPLTETKRVPGRAGRGDMFYAQWAAEYVKSLAASGNPAKDMAAMHNMEIRQVRNLIQACRTRGMLTATIPGRAGGDLTEKAMELLAVRGR